MSDSKISNHLLYICKNAQINDKSRHSVPEAGYRMFHKSQARAGLHSLLIAALIILEPLLSKRDKYLARGWEMRQMQNTTKEKKT